MRSFLTLVLHDLRQHVTDKAVLLFALVIPAVLSAVFNFAFSGLTDVELDPTTVAISVPEGDGAGQALRGALNGMADGGEVPVTVREVGPDEVAGLVDSGEAGVGVVVPEGFTEALRAGEGAVVDVSQGEDVGLTGDIVAGVVSSVLTRLDTDAATVAGAAGAGLDQAVIGALAQQVQQAQPQVATTVSEVTGEQLSLAAGIVAGQAGMFLFFTVGFALLNLLTEREWGTLPRLRTMPLPGWMVPAAKGVVGIVLGVVSTTVLLASGQLLFDGVDFGNWGVVMLLILATVTAATSVMAIILRVARTSEQASLAMSVIAISLGVAGGTFFRVPTEGWVGAVLQLNPIAALGRGLGITSGGGGLVEIAPVLGVLVGFTVVTLVLARVMPGRKDAL
ncbi:ABC transporter permease [Ornithinimicrobium panacihumi]|uniref:ABC transporter permease n=1 Tax=Ornithinimicrobium panacihumi TaxID=2008449 RepID=UPI003F88AC70